MRLAIVRQDYHPNGTVERVTERALEALLERNVAVSLYTRTWPKTRLQLIEPALCDPFFAGALWRDWGFARAACTLVRRSKPSLVEAHEPMLCCDIYHAGAGVHAVRQDVRLTHASSIERLKVACSPRLRYLRDIEHRMFGSSWLRAVICNSTMVRDEIRGRFALPESKLPVIYNPVDSAHFHPGLRADRAKLLDRHQVATDATVYLTVAGDAANCDVGTAIDALATLSPSTHLIVVGDDGNLDRHRDRARAFGVPSRVTLAGRQSDLRPYYGAADAFVLMSPYDPSPVSAQEAMACGLAIIASTRSGAAALVREHDGGLVCAPGDAAALAARMGTLQDASVRAGFAANARRAMLPLSPAATTLKLVLLYRDLLAAAGRRPTTLTRPPDPGG
ncbi:MAG: glycosyltransferase family 4 protein [Betaproteobacteria bacterium]